MEASRLLADELRRRGEEQAPYRQGLAGVEPLDGLEPSRAALQERSSTVEERH